MHTDWDSMSGNDQVRHCEHCNLQVNNLSSMTRQQAMRLIASFQADYACALSKSLMAVS